MIDPTQPERRAEYIGMAPAIAAMQQQIGGIAGDLSEIRAALTKLTEAVTRIAVIDQKMLDQSAATERAFQEISKLEKRHEEFTKDHDKAKEEDRKEDRKQHDEFKKFIYWFGGVFSVLSTLSGLFSVYAVSVISDMSSTKQAVEKHIAADKLTDERSLREMKKEMEGRIP